MNKVILVGNLVRDPEYRTTGSGIPVCNFRIAVTRRFANQQGVRESDFIDCVAWRQQADFVHRFFGKGRKIGVIGSLQTRTYDAQDGSKRYVAEINAEHIESLDRAPDTAPQPAAQAPKADPPFQSTRPARARPEITFKT